MTDGTSRSTPHEAEAWRRGHEPRVEFGWHCLTCGEEGRAFSATVAENLAAHHAAAASAQRPVTTEASVTEVPYRPTYAPVRVTSEQWHDGYGNGGSRGPEPLWSCSICGAVTVEDAWPLHEQWHATLAANNPSQAEPL